MANIILGAGITGLAAGFKTEFPIYEAKNQPGGICRSYRKSDFHFENGGGHWIFGDADARLFLDRTAKLTEYERKAGIYYNQVFPYPIQKHFSKVETAAAGSMKAWLAEKFGYDLCNFFFYPFNDKYTAGLYSQVIQDDPAKSPADKMTGYNDRFSYPAEGLDVLVDKMADKCDVHYNKKAIKINTRDRTVYFLDGEVVQYDRLISTLPLITMLKLCGERHPNLPYTSVLVLNIGAERGPRCPKDHWLYIPDRDVPFFRVGFYSNVDPAFAPDGSVSIYVERAFQKPMDITGYQDRVIRLLQEWGWIGKAEVCDPNWIDIGYTWLNKDSNRKLYLDELRQVGIESIGRYGKWKFQGIAESVMDGLSLEF